MVKKGEKLSEETKLKMSLNHDDRSGEKHPMYGKHHSKEARAKMSKSRMGKRMGKDNPRYGVHLSIETKEKIRKARKGIIFHSLATRRKLSKVLRGIPKTAEHKAKTINQWHDKEWKDRQIRLQRLGMIIRPNKPETIMLDLLNTHYPNQWRYTGDGTFIIDGLNPDFVNINGKKQIIEVFGDYWHGEGVRGYRQTEEGREEAFNSFGYATLIIWEHELRNTTKVLEKISIFMGRTQL